MDAWSKFEELCKTIPVIGPGARFIGIDFHLHTPASGKDYKDSGPEAYRRIAERLEHEGIEAVFVADHNTWEGIKLLEDSAKKYSKATRIYPGVELTVRAHAIQIADSSINKEETKIKELFPLPGTVPTLYRRGKTNRVARHKQPHRFWNTQSKTG